jgi:hypothetical protein
LDFGHRLLFQVKQNNTALPKLGLFISRSEGVENIDFVGPLERADLNHWSSQLSLMGATENVSTTSST